MNIFYRIVFLGLMSHSVVVHAMLVKTSLKSKKAGSSAFAPTQKRFYISPQGVQKVSKTIQYTPLQKFDLAHGLALTQSGALSNAYNVSLDSSSDWVKLVKKMFHRATPEGDLLVTKNIFKVATFITPETMGTLMGALETGELKKGAQEFTQGIIDTWYAHEGVQAKLSDQSDSEYGNKFKKEIENFFNLVTQLSQKNKNVLDSILLAFLYQKINHFDEDEEFHDWMHFIASINEYIPFFSAQELDEAHRKLAPSDYQAWLSGKVFELKLNVMPYSSSQYARFLAGHLPLVVSDIIGNSMVESIYPPKVIAGEFGYKGQRKKGDCVEAAVRDIVLNLFYDAKKKSFALSKYPHLPIDSRLKEYIEMSTIENINTLTMGQLFMDLVSERSTIGYMEKNYELASTAQNILQTLNTLLGTKAHDWQSLGEELTKMSDNKMHVVFDLKKMSLRDKVTITITDTLANNKKRIDLFIMRIHSYVAFPEREKLKYNRIDLKSLSELTNINPQLRSLFYLVRDININLKVSEAQEINPLLYLSWSVTNDKEKTGVIQKLLQDYSQDKDAIHYAYTLFKSLHTPEIQLLKDIHLFKEYCRDKDLEFKNKTKKTVLTDIGLWHLKTLLHEMTVEKAQQLVSSFMSVKDFDSALLSDQSLFESILFEKYGNNLLSYVLKKKLLRNEDFVLAKETAIEKVINDLEDTNFIKKFYSLNPLLLGELLDLLGKDASNYYASNLCSLLLKQNIDENNDQLYNAFYFGIFPLYASLLEKDYFKSLKMLGDLRPKLKRNTELYQLYDAKMNALQKKVMVPKE